MISEQKEIEENALDFIRKKFMKKKNSNYLNYTNPINYPKKVYGSRHEIIRTHIQNSNSISLHSQNNTKLNKENIIEEKNKTLNYSLNKNTIISPREIIKGNNIIVDKEKENEKNKEELKGKENEEEISKIILQYFLIHLISKNSLLN